ncbi:archaeosortase A [Haloarchaeobius amylolyticus]|uniref:archaeosortase A n=1 Tax=Haloarchaeobius amylolyticus TaxID=1198296 RepID=UPI00227033F8|nr:archaeosortase A [Haloarchaeobius amylolyticus]
MFPHLAALPTVFGMSTPDLLAWVVIAAFLVGAVADRFDRRVATYWLAGTWVLFGVFWLAVFPHFAFEVRSFVEGGLALFAVPASIYTGYLLLQGRERLVTLSKAVGVMGLIYHPTQAIPFVRRALIEEVARETLWGIQLLGYNPEFTTGPEYGYLNMFVFSEFSTYIVYACTGIGSMAIFAGLIVAVEAPLRRKLQSFALAIGVIWVLNFVRNVFVAIAAGKGWFTQGPILWLATTAGVPENHTSFWFAHSVLSQTLSVFALVGITWAVVHVLPELLGVLEEVLFVATGEEYDLADALDLNDPVRADGGQVDGGD